MSKLTVLLSSAWTYINKPVKKRKPWIYILVLCGVIVFVAAWTLSELELGFYKANPQINNQEYFSIKEQRYKTFVQILGGIGIFIGIILTFRRIKASEDQVKAMQRQIQVAEDGQITERFTRAIDQLGKSGPENLTVRLGGIYALERLSKESDKYYWTVMEVLTAFIRTNSPAPEKSEEAEPEEITPELSTDIQAALTVIGRREKAYGRGEKQKLNLRRTNLRKADLIKANLAMAVLVRADLTGACLLGANCSGASLNGANLSEAELNWANFTMATLTEANLTGANLTGANLTRATLTTATLTEAYLFGVNLLGADLTGANLFDANLFETNLTGAGLSKAILVRANIHKANLTRANLTKADLTEANLSIANLSGANLSGAYLTKTNLFGADFTGASLVGADLTGAGLSKAKNLTIEQLCEAKTLYQARFDPGLEAQVKEKCPHLLEKPKDEDEED